MPSSRRPERSTRECTRPPAGGGSWLRAKLTRPGPAPSPVIVCRAALARARVSAVAAESAATATPAAATVAVAAAPVTSGTDSPSPGSGQLPHSPSPPHPRLHDHRVGRPCHDWQVCSPIAKVGRRARARPLFSLVPFSLNANKRGRGVGRGRGGYGTPCWGSALPKPGGLWRGYNASSGAGPAQMRLTGSLELGFGFASTRISVVAVHLRYSSLASTRQFIPRT